MQQEISNYLPNLLLDFIAKMDSRGLAMGLVGGTVRNYYLRLPCGNDFDFEIRLKQVSDQQFEFLEKALEGFKFQKLNYQVYRIELADNSIIELSFPRKEIFDEGLGNTHSNFTASFDSLLTYPEAASRRDFTCNAIMWEYSNGLWRVEDPLGGIEDIQDKKLRICSDSFSRDPVRLLRALRFSIKYDFEIEQQISDVFRDYDWSDFSCFYMRNEANKSRRPLLFYIRLSLLLSSSTDSDVLLKQFLAKKMDVLEIKPLLKQLIFLPVKLRQHLSEVFGLKVDQNEYRWPILQEEINKQSYQDFKTSGIVFDVHAKYV